MAERTVKKGLVYTNDKCVGCNKCIRSCPVLTANVAEDAKINIDFLKSIR